MYSTINRWLVIASIILGPASHLIAFPPPPSFSIIDSTHDSTAYDVSSDGSVIVGEKQTTPGREAFRWSESTGMIGLGDVSGIPQSAAFAVSADGSVIGGRTVTSQAFRWTQSTGMVGLPHIANGFQAEASGISGDGSTLVGYDRLSGSGFDRAIRWTQQGGAMSLGEIPGSPVIRATDASYDGSTIVGWSEAPERAYKWMPSTGYVGLGVLTGYSSSRATAVSTDGNTIVGVCSSGEFQAFRWTPTGGMKTLGIIPGGFAYSYAYDVSGDGSIVVGTAQVNANIQSRTAFVFLPGAGMKNLESMLQSELGLDLMGWHLKNAYAISADGTTVVGDAVNQNGIRGAYRAVIPEPCSSALFCLSIVLLSHRRWPTGNVKSSR